MQRGVRSVKASAFGYARATSISNAIELLEAHGDRAKVLSGGQSLLPALNLRLLVPDLVIDIRALAELRGITVDGGLIKVGALTLHCELLKSTDVAAYAPLVAEAIAHVAHPAIRNRGTIGGSLVHADPAVGRRALAPERSQIRAAKCHCDRPRLLAGRGSRSRRCYKPRHRGRCCRTRRCGLQ